MDLSKYNLFQLSASQKKKADKIVKLITELQRENINTILVSAPQNKLSFYGCDVWLDDMYEIMHMENKTNFMYNPKQQPAIIDTCAY